MTEEQNEQTTFNAEVYEEKMKRIDAEIRTNNLAEENKDLQHRLDIAQGFLDRDTEYQELKNRNAELKGKYAHATREAETYKQFWENQKETIASYEADLNKVKEENYNNKKQLEEVKADCDFALEGKDVEIMELKKENTELNDKLNNWVKCAELRLANWQKYETENNKLLDVINTQDVKIADLEKQIKVLTQNLEDTEICNKALEKKVEVAKQIIKRLLSLYFYPVVTDKDLKRKDEIIEQTEQFLGEKND